MKLTSSLLIRAAVFVVGGLSLTLGQTGFAQKYMDNATNVQQSVFGNKAMGYSQREYGKEVSEQNQSMTGDRNNLGVNQGASSPQNQRLQNQPGKAKFEGSELDVTKPIPATYSNNSEATGEVKTGQAVGIDTKPEIQTEMKNLDPTAMSNVADMAEVEDNEAGGGVGGSDFFDGGTLGGAGSDSNPKSVAGADTTGAFEAGTEATKALQEANAKLEPQSSQQGEKTNANQCQGSRGGSAGEDAKLLMHSGFDGFLNNLINVANENAGSPCSSRAASKTYANVVYMVQQMYKSCYIPMALLFLLPGAIITNTKTLVSFGILSGKDEDTVSPFTGILRSIIAIFLIPATQLALSYIVDVGNALEESAKQYVSLPLIYLWAEEQVQTFGPDQQGQLLKNLPVVPQAPYLGKFAGMPVKGAVLEQCGGLQDALTELANECFHMFTIGLNVISGFQVVMLCYLFLMGPLAAAFFAWPSVGRDLFRKAFASWIDGVTVLSLWKFWWTVVLVCMTARLESGNINPYDIWEVYYLIAFMSIMLVVPFNPFDFRPGEIVTHVLGKAEGIAAKVAQGGKGGGSSGGGKARGGGKK